MEVAARLPDPLSGEGDMAHNWRMWREDFEVYLKVTGYEQQSKETRAYLLRNQIGKVGRDTIERIIASEPFDKNDIDVLLQKLECYFNPRINETEERYKFFTRARGKYESIEEYICQLTKMSKSCNFGDMADSLIRDRVIADLLDINLRKKCFQEDNLDLQKLISIYNEHKSIVLANKQTSNIRQNDNRNFMNTNGEPVKGPQLNGPAHKTPCWRCRQFHPIKRCPAWGHKCNKCGQMHHLTICCKNNNINREENEIKNKNKIQVDVKDRVDQKETSSKVKGSLTKGTGTDSPTFATSPMPNLYPSAPPLNEVQELNPFANSSNSQQPTVNLNNSVFSKGSTVNSQRKQDERIQKQAPSPYRETTLVRGMSQNVLKNPRVKIEPQTGVKDEGCIIS